MYEWVCVCVGADPVLSSEKNSPPISPVDKTTNNNLTMCVVTTPAPIHAWTP